MTVSTIEDSYEYGIITVNNYADSAYLTYAVADREAGSVGDDITTWLMDGFYTINYAISNSTNKNSNGFLYAGDNSVVSATTSFTDFDMVMVYPTYEITVKEIERVTHFDIVASVAHNGPYEEEYTVAGSGDVLTLQYDVKNPPAVYTAGNYELEIRTNLYANNSVKITVPNGNEYLTVLPETNFVYLKLVNDAMLTQTYNRKAFTLTLVRDVLKLRKIQVKSMNKATVDAHEMFLLASLLLTAYTYNVMCHVVL